MQLRQVASPMGGGNAHEVVHDRPSRARTVEARQEILGDQTSLAVGDEIDPSVGVQPVNLLNLPVQLPCGQLDRQERVALRIRSVKAIRARAGPSLDSPVREIEDGARREAERPEVRFIERGLRPNPAPSVSRSGGPNACDSDDQVLVRGSGSFRSPTELLGRRDARRRSACGVRASGPCGRRLAGHVAGDGRGGPARRIGRLLFAGDAPPSGRYRLAQSTQGASDQVPQSGEGSPGPSRLLTKGSDCPGSRLGPEVTRRSPHVLVGGNERDHGGTAREEHFRIDVLASGPDSEMQPRSPSTGMPAPALAQDLTLRHPVVR
jgi:hypothetical protein